MKINVTEQDIRDGARTCNQGCMIALALQRQGVEYLAVTPGGVHLKGNRVMPFGDEVTRRVRAFDRSTALEPFQFEYDEGKIEDSDFGDAFLNYCEKCGREGVAADSHARMLANRRSRARAARAAMVEAQETVTREEVAL